jgi:PIN domain nuclease of toxin-antitoxin system
LASDSSILVLPISEKDLSNYLLLPIFSDHRDPFDKLIIATAMEDNLTIITTDKKFILYKELVDIIW